MLCHLVLKLQIYLTVRQKERQVHLLYLTGERLCVFATVSIKTIFFIMSNTLYDHNRTAAV